MIRLNKAVFISDFPYMLLCLALFGVSYVLALMITSIVQPSVASSVVIFGALSMLVVLGALPSFVPSALRVTLRELGVQAMRDLAYELPLSRSCRLFIVESVWHGRNRATPAVQAFVYLRLVLVVVSIIAGLLGGIQYAYLSETPKADEVPWESLCFVLAVQCALLVLTEFSQQAQKRYEKKLRKQVKKGCKC